MNGEQRLILNEQEISQKIKRIAYEIYENNLDEGELVLAGIYDRGYFLASSLKDELEKISSLKIKLVKITINKETPLESGVEMDCDAGDLIDYSIIVVDDVLNTGRTLAYSLKPFLNIKIKKLQTAFLVNRSHKSFPISADYTGLELSTTIENHIYVTLEEGKGAVYLH
jgi:pyrimidine operon attenuation protein / uracil phosphoribosyltransferase